MRTVQGRKRRRVWLNWLLVPVLLLSGWFLLKSVWGLWAKERLTRDERRVAEQKRAELQTRESDLTAKVESLGTALGVEAALRGKFPVVKPGERVVNVVDDGSLEIIKPAPPAPWWQKLGEILLFWRK